MSYGRVEACVGVRGCADGLGTALQAGGSRV